jgi:hypothetical protein
VAVGDAPAVEFREMYINHPAMPSSFNNLFIELQKFAISIKSMNAKAKYQANRLPASGHSAD